MTLKMDLRRLWSASTGSANFTLNHVLFIVERVVLLLKKLGTLPFLLRKMTLLVFNMTVLIQFQKITGEMYCLYFWTQLKLDVIRVRFQNAYGPGEILGAGEWRGNVNTIWRNAIPTIIWKSMNSQEIEVFGEGLATRDFIYVKDLARGVINAANKGVAGEVYNLATEKETRIIDLVNIIVRETNSNSEIIIKPRRA